MQVEICQGRTEGFRKKGVMEEKMDKLGNLMDTGFLDLQ
jgi:hypothetical protein